MEEMGEIVGGCPGEEVTVGVMAGGQADDAYVQASLVEARNESLSGVLARMVFVLIESDIDTAVTVLAELGQLRGG